MHLVLDALNVLKIRCKIKYSHAGSCVKFSTLKSDAAKSKVLVSYNYTEVQDLSKYI